MIQTAILPLVILTGSVALFLFRWNLYGVFLYATGKAPGCPLGTALVTIPRDQKHNRNRTSIEGKMKLLRANESNSLGLWQTPAGEFWSPQVAATKESLADELAERDDEIYGGSAYGVKPGDVVLDCGASIGVFVREALDRGASRVIAVEPFRQNIECLERNFKNEVEQGKVIIYRKGLWHEEAELPIHAGDSPAAGTFVLTSQWNREVEVLPLTTIDRMLEELGIDRVDFIKMDIEGAEQNALRGAARVIGRDRPRLAISAYHLPADPVEIPAIVKQIHPGYRLKCRTARYIFRGYRHASFSPLVYLFLP